MFIGKYINDFYFDLIIDEYDKQFLNSLNEDNFIKIYNLFKKYNFNYIQDIMLNYLEIFSMEYDSVSKGIELLKEKLGDNFVSIIGNNMNYLNILLEIAMEGE